jgi:hypothetical protein
MEKKTMVIGNLFGRLLVNAVPEMNRNIFRNCSRCYGNPFGFNQGMAALS